MMGDALSHTALPGIIVAFLTAAALRSAGWIQPDTFHAAEQGMLFGGAVLAGTGFMFMGFLVVSFLWPMVLSAAVWLPMVPSRWSAPPTWRNVLPRAEATPACSRETLDISVLIAGGIILIEILAALIYVAAG